MANNPGSTTSPRPPRRTSGESVKDTLDSIIIAFILAFVFRAFVVEAFVIPTGSMAPTLSGAHGTMVCENCGWEYTYGLTDYANLRAMSARAAGLPRVTRNSVAVCPNCRFPNHTIDINDALANQESGDRILVLKWPFDIGGPLLGPHRWDVIVFKDPSDGVTNYIKRLAGLPNEVLEIIDGDVYAVPTDKLTEVTRATLDAARHVKYLRRLVNELHSDQIERDDIPAAARDQLSPRYIQHAAAQVEAQMPAVLAELDGKLTIQRKTALAQDALWRVVYDHDYPPRYRDTDQPFWTPRLSEGDWSVEERTLRFNGIGAPEQAVELMASITSFCSYNVITGAGPINYGRLGGMPVSDVRLRFVADYQSGNGAISIRLVKRDDMFVGEFAADGTVRLLHAMTTNPDQLVELASTRIRPFTLGHQVALSMQNLDHRVSLFVEGEEVLATTDAQYTPNLTALRTIPPLPTPPVVVTARDIDVSLSHVIAERDVYYISEVPRESRPLGFGPWGTCNHPMLLRSGEYFMLGDNSAQSKDSRLWDEVGPQLRRRWENYQLGTVPRDQLIGRAFFVYWPSGLRTRVLPFLSNVGWIPNFGRMRWIR